MKIAVTIVFLAHAFKALSIDFFVSIEPSGTASPPPTILNSYEVSLNLGDLQDGPPAITFSLPNEDVVTIQKNSFYPREGYEYYDEEEHPPGTPPFWIPTGTPINEISYKWSGSSDKYDVLLTFNRGQLMGLITSNDTRYGIYLASDNTTYMMDEFNLNFFPPTDTIGLDENMVKEGEPFSDNQTSIGTIKSFNKTAYDINETRNSNTTNIDVLILWTEEARVEAGGNPADPDDTADIDTLMMFATNHANEAFTNSQMNTRITRFHTAQYIGFQYSGVDGEFQDLRNLKNDTTVQITRNLVGADVVVAVVGNNFTLFSACGVAYVQTYPTCSDEVPVPGCNVGPAFNSSAYSITTEFCAIWDDTFTHELGHNLGANHVLGESGAAFENAVINNNYPDAFGFRSSRFKSIMSIFNTTSNPTTARRLYFSNPNVVVDGAPIGTTANANNAKVIDDLSPVVSNFRARPDVIFINGFE